MNTATTLRAAKVDIIIPFLSECHLWCLSQLHPPIFLWQSPTYSWASNALHTCSCIMPGSTNSDGNHSYSLCSCCYRFVTINIYKVHPEDSSDMAFFFSKHQTITDKALPYLRWIFVYRIASGWWVHQRVSGHCVDNFSACYLFTSRNMVRHGSKEMETMKMGLQWSGRMEIVLDAKFMQFFTFSWALFLDRCPRPCMQWW